MRFQIIKWASLLGAIVLQIPWLLQPIPVGLKLATGAFLLFSCVRPTRALLAAAIAGPIANSMLLLMGIPVPGTRLLEQMVLAVTTGTLLNARADSPPTRTLVPAALVGFIGLASAAALLPSRLFAADPHVATWSYLVSLWGAPHFNPDVTWAPLVLALYLVEAMALVWTTEVTLRRNPSLLQPLILCLLAGHAVAASLNLLQLHHEVVASGVGPSVWRQILTSRISLQYDRNAAGSVYVFIALSAIAFLRLPDVRRYAVLVLLAAILLGGLWLTGSRAALAIFLATLAGVSLARGFRTLMLGAIIGLLAAAWLYVAFYPQGRNPDDQSTIEGRRTMAKVGMRMTSSAPVYGVGIGTFYERSRTFGAPFTENAHNNFVQVLAEQGASGLAGLIGLIVIAAGPGLAARLTRDRTVKWLITGLAAFILTWLAGHPLLEPDAQFIFAMAVGMVASVAPALRPANASRGSWVLLAAVLILAISLPVRARAATQLETGSGLSEWRAAPGNIRYRQGGPEFSLYLPSRHPVLIGMRTTRPGDVVRVELRVRGQLVRVLVVTDKWEPQLCSLALSHWGYERVDFRVVSDSAPEGAPLRIDVKRPIDQ